MIAGYEGTPAAVTARRTAVTAVLTDLGGERRRRGSRPFLGRRALRRAVPPRLDARRRGAGRDPRDRDVLVATSGRCTTRCRPHCAARSVSRRSCSATSPTSTRPVPRSTSPWLPPRATTRSAAGARPRRPRWTRSWRAGATITHHHAVGTDHQPWLEAEIGAGRHRGAAGRQGRRRPRGDPQPRRAGALSAQPRSRHAQLWKVQTRSWVGTAAVTDSRDSPAISNASPAASGSARLDRIERAGDHERVDQRRRRQVDGLAGRQVGHRKGRARHVEGEPRRRRPPGPARVGSGRASPSGAPGRRPCCRGAATSGRSGSRTPPACSLWVVPRPARGHRQPTRTAVSTCRSRPRGPARRSPPR